MSVYIPLFTVAIPVNYTSEIREFLSYYYIQMLRSWRVRTRECMGKQEEEKRNQDIICERKLEGKDHFEDLAVDEKL
jgi:hypothetical protein